MNPHQKPVPMRAIHKHKGFLLLHEFERLQVLAIMTQCQTHSGHALNLKGVISRVQRLQIDDELAILLQTITHSLFVAASIVHPHDVHAPREDLQVCKFNNLQKRRSEMLICPLHIYISFSVGVGLDEVGDQLNEPNLLLLLFCAQSGLRTRGLQNQKELFEHIYKITLEFQP